MFQQSTTPRAASTGRSFGGVAISVVIHLAAGAAAILIAQAPLAQTPKFMKSALTYIALSAPVAMPPPIDVPMMLPVIERRDRTPVLEKQDPAYVPMPVAVFERQEPAFIPVPPDVTIDARL